MQRDRKSRWWDQDVRERAKITKALKRKHEVMTSKSGTCSSIPGYPDSKPSMNRRGYDPGQSRIRTICPDVTSHIIHHGMDVVKRALIARPSGICNRCQLEVRRESDGRGREFIDCTAGRGRQDRGHHALPRPHRGRAESGSRGDRAACRGSATARVRRCWLPESAHFHRGHDPGLGPSSLALLERMIGSRACSARKLALR